MTGSTKILTVSYGTFSCTLEGFDDPFNTMRDIAEYFRDLAADDRYFGAEPPTPDVDMLQNIAQRDVTQRVEARVADTGVSLVAQESAPAAAEPAQPVGGNLTHDDDFLMPDEPEDVLSVDPNVAPIEGAPAESVAEKLRRIRAVVSQNVVPQPETAVVADPEGEPTRDRANTETINAIAADLSDDEDALLLNEDDEPTEKPEIETVAERVVEETEATIEVVPAPEAEVEPDTDGGDEEYEDAGENEPLMQSPFGIPEDVEENFSYQSEAKEAEVEQDDINSETDAEIASRIAKIAAASRRTTVPLEPIAESEDVGRLLNETDNKLNDDESVRRRRVISQMRAAVAATKADRLVSRRVVSKELEDAEDQSPYRQDLDVAISEEEDVAPKAESNPLVLVSSQRIDLDDDAVPSEGFARFAKDVGAKELPDLMEAAAAYAAFVEGQPSFSRPEIMKRVARYDPALNVSREEGLRSFGQLLRQGKIRKIERGQFTITDETRFNPQERIAGE